MGANQRTPIQEAVIKLREAAGGISQQELSNRMRKAVVTIARWETSKPPSGAALMELQKVSLDHGQYDLAFIFKKALAEEMGTIGIPMTIEEKIYHDALMDLLRNRHIKGLKSFSREILDLLLSGYSKLIRDVRAGKRLVGTAIDEAEYTLLELQELAKQKNSPAR